MTPQEFAPDAVDVGPDEDLRYSMPPGGTAGESAITAALLPTDSGIDYAPKQLPVKAPRVRVKKPDNPGQESFDELLTFLSNLPQTLPMKTRTFRVFGHRVAWNHRRDIARLAGIALLEQMSSWEFARVVQQGGYGLESYMQTLKSIRDNAGAEAKDRMAAADKLLQLFSVFMSGVTREELPKANTDQPGNIMQILVDMRGEGDANGTKQLPEETSLPALGDSNASD